MLCEVGSIEILCEVEFVFTLQMIQLPKLQRFTVSNELSLKIQGATVISGTQWFSIF